jgi:extracellular factor (EF) 3-hydroxypalmitic acid methyl ester biosynthesis protein
MAAFKFLTDEERNRLLERAQTLTCADGDRILEEGARRRAIFIVRSGTVSIEKEHLGTGIPLDELGEGEVFGEMSFLEDTGASASVVAQGPVELQVLEAGDIEQLLDSDPRLAANFYRSLAFLLSGRLRHSTAEFVSIPFSAG